MLFIFLKYNKKFQRHIKKIIYIWLKITTGGIELRPDVYLPTLCGPVLLYV